MNIKDVAALSGVSTATVSRALSSPDRVAPATRRRIMTMIDKHGYAVNAAAQTLRSQRAKCVLVLTTAFDATFLAFASGCVPKLVSAGMNVMVADESSLAASGRSAETAYAEQRVDFILRYGEYRTLKATIPHLVIPAAQDCVDAQASGETEADNVIHHVCSINDVACKRGAIGPSSDGKVYATAIR